MPVFLQKYWPEVVQLSKMQGKTYLEMPGAVPGCTGVGLETKENHFHQITGKADDLPRKFTVIPRVSKKKKPLLNA